ncbi:MAG: ABC transporter permease, partial [Bacteroidia bacterium]|nr:ABC transporter permease [Bacteroidia bacterium]
RKRLNIALELIREPAVLFVDEPTSGLSSRDSENVMDLLKELAASGKLVFVVIHQPSSDIYKLFDKLLLLDTGGYPIYYGNPLDAIRYFKRMVQHIHSEQCECVACGNVNPEQIFDIIETKVVDENGNLTAERKIPPNKWNEWFQSIRTNFSATTTLIPPQLPPLALQLPSVFRQFHIFAMRDLKAKLSNRAYLIINLIQAPVLALLLGWALRYQPLDETRKLGYTLFHNENYPITLFIGVLVALFIGLSVSAEEILRDRKLLKREAFLHLNRWSYLLAKIGILFSLSAIQTLTFVLVSNAISETISFWWSDWLVLFSTACFANLLGLNLSATFQQAVTVYIMIPILLIPQIIFSGAMVRFEKLHRWIVTPGEVPWIAETLASRWAFEALVTDHFLTNQYRKEFVPEDKLLSEYQF